MCRIVDLHETVKSWYGGSQSGITKPADASVFGVTNYIATCLAAQDLDAVIGWAGPSL